MSDANKAVIIARVSSKRQEDEGYSLPAQKRLLNSYAIDKGLKPLKSYEIAESASKNEQRRKRLSYHAQELQISRVA